jgi:hypothetical protein
VFDSATNRLYLFRESEIKCVGLHSAGGRALTVVTFGWRPNPTISVPSIDQAAAMPLRCVRVGNVVVPTRFTDVVGQRPSFWLARPSALSKLRPLLVVLQTSASSACDYASTTHQWASTVSSSPIGWG